MKTITFKLLVILFCLLNSLHFYGQALSSTQIDSLVAETINRLPQQAGIAITVVKDNKVIHLKGYGVASIETKEKVDENTLFAIGSNSKAFTAAALAILVDENRLSWEDKVVKYIPEFKMYDPYVTDNFTILDLLTHRSGLGEGAGDLMLFPDGNDFTIKDVLKSFQYQKPISSFRTKYDYDNLLYIVASEVIKRISGMEYKVFIQNRIFDPLQMRNSATSFGTVKNKNNLALPHSSENGPLKQINSFSHELLDGPGGIYSNVNDLSKWLLVHLNKGKYGEKLEKQLFSESAQQEMWKPHTNRNFKVISKGRYNNHFEAYGLGWHIVDYCSKIVLWHTGGVPGMLSQTILVPELNLGIVVLTNTFPGGASYMTLARSILDSYLGVVKRDWIKMAIDNLKSAQNSVDTVETSVWKTVENSKKIQINNESYIGTYTDNWFGQVSIYEKEGKLWFKSLRSPKLNGQMFFYKATTFAIKWEYTDMPCNAFATFSLDTEGKAISVKMKGISPRIDFSFDFQDLDLVRVK
jgi:CubicO group peptidase (beta-lactamase class C family)